MSLIPDEDIQKVIDASDFVQIASECIPDLKQKSGRFVACCPFHKEKTPSFQIDPNQQLFYCFGCGEGGNVVTFVEKIYDMNFPEAMEFLADKANIQLHKTGGKNYSKSEKGRLMEAVKLSAEFYHNQLMKVKSAGSNAARRYLGSRSMGSEVSKRWNLGFAPGNDALTKYLLSKKFSDKNLVDANLCVKDSSGRLHDRFYNRVMFPINDANGNVIAFGGRITDDGQPKYLNSSENVLFHKSQVMYGLDKAKKNMTSSGTAIVVEGYTDVIAMHEAGINYAVATLGTALTRQHIRMLNQHAKKKIIYLFDGDEAGQRAAERALNFIDQIDRPEVHGKRAELLALTLPDNMDPKEFIDKYGKDKLIELLDSAQPLIIYGIDRKLSTFDMSVPGSKSRAALAAVQVLAPIKDSLLAKEYCSIIAEKTGMRNEDLLNELSKLKKPRDFDDEYEKKDETQTKEEVSLPSSRTSSLENELLCVFAKHPEIIKDFLDEGFSYGWSVDSHKKLFEYIKHALSENPSIKAKELIMKVHQKNAKTANMLTRMSQMYDIKANPKRHAQYLVLCLKSEEINSQIEKMKEKFRAMAECDEKNQLYKNLVELQSKQVEIIDKANGMI